MKITGVTPRAIAEPGGREYLVVRVDTDDGVSGYAETEAGHAPRIAVARLKRELQRLIGMNPARAVGVDEDLRLAGASHTSRASANVACLDILGKATRAPVHEILGGPTRHKVRAMAALAGGSDAEVRESVLAAKAEGYRAFSVPLTMPSGPGRGRRFYADARATLDGLRDAAGSECDFVLDCGGRLSPGEALSMADRMEGFHLLWMDEPCGDLSATAQASVSKGSVTPVGYGRGFTSNARFQDLLREDGVDILRPALATRGLTSIRKAAAIGETYYVAVAPFHRGGPIGTAAGIQVCAALPNSFVQETPFSADLADRQIRAAISGWDEKPAHGFFPLSSKPGLGLDVDEGALDAYTVAR
ncbi:MAG: mandelate racemase/muconate lactonizing enzyme family protein [Acidobacteria bacterium]|nr:mandelate racemase/muconate lactonizing enzyme family protein [Acidobacteriota bacterium]